MLQLNVFKFNKIVKRDFLISMLYKDSYCLAGILAVYLHDVSCYICL